MKSARHQAILDLIEKYPLDRQEDLLEHLRRAGFDVTQATVSRDIRELRLVKTATGEGGYRYMPANGNGKVLNLASNYASLFTYLMNGLVVFHIGIPCAISNILGNLLGSHFALKKGARFIRPMMLVVLVLLLGKLISDAVL